MFAVGGNDGNLRLYDVKSNYNQPLNLSGLSSINEIYFSYDNCWLAAASNKIYLFSGKCMKNQAQIAPLPKCPVDQFLTATLQCQSCISSMAGCRKCINASYCLVCSNQNYLNSSNLCSPCSQINIRCIECSDGTTCTKCITTYYKNGSGCSLCFEAMPGCLTCYNSTYCIACATNSYYMNTTTNKCMVCSAAINNCVECLSNSTCIACEHSYFITSTNSCSKCNLNCTVCSNSSTNCS